MINQPNDPGLLVFDMDGTILPSAKPVYAAIRRVYAKANLPVPLTEQDVEKYLGFSSDEFYQAVTPEDSPLSWQDLRLRVRSEYISTLKECAATYPGVKETLETLRKRGYKLALCSNSGINWFYAAISALNIREYFDHVECIEDRHYDKTQIINRLKEVYGIASAAVIGDRTSDIEAARQTGSLAVGALYGYGGKEPEQADITISCFTDLLKIFDRKVPVFDRIKQEIQQRKLKSRAFVVGINGIDLSGKTEFTNALADYLTVNKFKVMVIHLDDFHHPRAYRNSGPDPVENYWTRNFNYELLIRDLFIPIREKQEYSIKMTLLDLQSDKYEVQQQFSFDRDTIVLFEGVFLFREELADYLDYKLFIDIPFAESRRRADIRDVPIYGTGMLKRYEEKYWPAQRKYLDQYPPAQIADLVIDNTNWEYPVMNTK
jgi:phosphoglycolate phosphatase-like HAD superfamily hydrolase/uridine kinase